MEDKRISGTYLEPSDFRTPQFQQACEVVQRCRLFYGKPWTCTFEDVKAVAEFIATDDREVLSVWSGAAPLIREIVAGAA